jgi:hypothetical protein
MTARRSIVRLTVLCALCLCAFSAASASAAGTTQFTTQFTCVPGEQTQGFSDADCSTASATGPFHHVSVANGTTTTLKSVGTTNQVLSETVGGIAFQITCTNESNVGEATNEEVEGEVKGEKRMTITGKNIVITYTGCTVTKPAGNGCVVNSVGKAAGTIVTNNLKSMSFLTPNKGIRFEPTTGTTIVEIVVSGCTTTALNGTKVLTGTANATPRGAFLDANAAGSALTIGGQAARLTGTSTISGRTKGSEQAFTPLSVTEG